MFIFGNTGCYDCNGNAAVEWFGVEPSVLWSASLAAFLLAGAVCKFRQATP